MIPDSKSSHSHHHYSFHGMFHSLASRSAEFSRKNLVMLIAALAAVITSFIVPPDKEYLGYLDYGTLICLFCTLAVICALKNIHFFTIVASKIVALTGNMRMAAIALIYITFIGSMLIANDMALLTFLPLGYFVLHCTGNEQYMAKLFVLQNIAANLGGMLTPFGNPQNLYLYSYFNIPTLEFLKIMVVPFAVAVILVTASCFMFPKKQLTLTETPYGTILRKKTFYKISC